MPVTAVEAVLGDVHLVNGLSIKKVSNQSKVQTPRHIRAEDKVLDWRPAGKSQLSEAELVPGEGGERQQRQPPLQVEHAVQQQVQLQHPLSEHQQDAGDDTADVKTGAGGADGDHQGGEAQPGPTDGGGRDRDPYGRVQEHGPGAKL